jgi:16S rRNA (cytidine1402-2'-O)-methyltransferase
MGTVYLIPSLLDEEGILALPPCLPDAIERCTAFFVERERTTRRFFKQLWRTQRPGSEMRIDDYEWITMEDPGASGRFRELLRDGKTVGIVSEAGCPGIADPGQAFAAIAQEMNAVVKPLSGPSSLFLALMASGLNGQQFRFWGYLPVDAGQRDQRVRELEQESVRTGGTQLCIETPYRNLALLESFLRCCKPQTRLCIAVQLTGPGEWVRTRSIAEWKKQQPDLHKKPVIFCLQAMGPVPI